MNQEFYRYASVGNRTQKIISHPDQQIAYLPGLDISFKQHQAKQCVLMLACVRILPGLASSYCLNYQLTDRHCTTLIELDQHVNVISRTGYYPFGGTACWSAGNRGDYAHQRWGFTGRERDATGLSFFGFRYYAPWLMHWLNPDPAGTIDGLNLLRMVRNNPLTFIDPNGCMPVNNPQGPTPEDSATSRHHVSHSNRAAGTREINFVPETMSGIPLTTNGWRITGNNTPQADRSESTKIFYSKVADYISLYRGYEEPFITELAFMKQWHSDEANALGSLKFNFFRSLYHQQVYLPLSQGFKALSDVDLNSCNGMNLSDEQKLYEKWVTKWLSVQNSVTLERNNGLIIVPGQTSFLVCDEIGYQAQQSYVISRRCAEYYMQMYENHYNSTQNHSLNLSRPCNFLKPQPVLTIN